MLNNIEKTGIGVPFIKEVEKDTWNTKLGDFYTGMYYYMLGGDLNNFGNADNTQILGNCPAIESIIVTPFLDPYTLPIRLTKIPYDIKRFGSTSDNTRCGLTEDAYVFRINNQCRHFIEKDISTFKPYPNLGEVRTTERNWRNESKLYQFPYSYAMLCDHFNPPLVIKYNYLENKDTNKVKGVFTLSDKCTYKLYIEGYKGDNVGNMESLTSNASLQLPVTSSAYSQFLATSRSSFVANNESVLRDSLIGGATNIASNLAMGNVVGAIGSALKTGVNTYNNIQQSMAKISDLMSTPRTVKSMGNDTVFSLTNSNSKIELIRYRISNQFLKKIGDFFAMYGYKQNKIMRVNTRSRYYYNYVKMLDCNIVGKNISKEHLYKIKKIFENGVTIWHVDRDGVKPLDYSLDNVEVNRKC